MDKKNNTLAKGAALGAGLVAIAAAAAGTYFLYGSKNATKNRKKIQSWTLKAKGEVLEKLEKAKEVNEEMYNTVVKQISEKYQAAKKIDKKDVEEFVRELKSHWKSIAKEMAAFHKKNHKK